jgi:myo-inositol-1(or 4)-monophosphatase
MDSEVTARIKAGEQAVLRQRETLRARFGCCTSEWKTDGTRVTDADLAISVGIFAELSSRFPEDHFCSEETDPGLEVQPLTRRFAWILDPIDGTNNYALGIPFCAISLALLDHGVPVYGLIWDMARGVLMKGGPGVGLIENEQPAFASVEAPSKQSLIAVHSPIAPEHQRLLAAIIDSFKLRALGSGSLHLAYVANGLINGAVDHSVRVWDIAAAYAFCLGAGAEVRFLNGEVFPLKVFDLKMDPIHYIAGNPAMVRKLSELNDAARSGVR